VLLPAATDDTAALLSRLDRLEKRLAATAQPTAAPAAATAPPAPAPQPAPTKQEKSAAPEPATDPEPDPAPAPATAAAEAAPPAPAPVGGVVDLGAIRRLWDSVLDSVKTQSRTAHALMMSSQIQSLEGNNLVLTFSSQSLVSRFTADVAPILTQALKDVVGVDIRVSAIAAGEPAKLPVDNAPSAVPPASPAPEMSADDIEESQDLDGSTDADPEAAALALLQDGLGAQVIGEIDQS
jgi:DNA polymerase-3 subunit gamma/tau